MKPTDVVPSLSWGLTVYYIISSLTVLFIGWLFGISSQFSFYTLVTSSLLYGTFNWKINHNHKNARFFLSSAAEEETGVKYGKEMVRDFSVNSCKLIRHLPLTIVCLPSFMISIHSTSPDIGWVTIFATVICLLSGMKSLAAMFRLIKIYRLTKTPEDSLE